MDGPADSHAHTGSTKRVFKKYKHMKLLVIMVGGIRRELEGATNYIICIHEILKQFNKNMSLSQCNF